MAFIQNWLNAVLRIPGSISHSIWSARSVFYNNPLMRMRYDVATWRAQMRYYRSIPGSLGNQMVPAELRGWGRKGRSGKDQTAAVLDVPEADPRLQRRGRRRGRRMKAPARRAAVSQIHLINQANGERSVLHIGQETGHTSAEISLPSAGITPLLLEFSQGEAQPHEETAQLTYVYGKSNVLVNGVPVNKHAMVKDGSTITVDDITYRVELFSFRQLPLITRVDAAWATNVGPIRDVNQDAIGIYQHRRAYLFAVADGVGGGYAGDKVSEFAVQYLLTVFKKNIPYNLPWREVFQKAYEYINAEVRHFVSAAPSPAGCTLTAVVIREWMAHIAHVGDSRVYLMRGTQFRLLTTDHNRTVAVEANGSSKLPARTRTILDKAIGKTDLIEPDIFSIPLQPGDRLLLITDGISHNVSDEDIYQLLALRRVDEVPDLLIEMTNSHENHDNASVILVHVLESVYERDDWAAVSDERVYVGGASYPLFLEKPREMTTRHPSALQYGCVLIFALLLLAGCLWSGVQLWQGAQRMAANLTVPTASATPTRLSDVVIPSLTPAPLSLPGATPTVQTTTIPTLTLPPAITPLAPTSTLRAPADRATAL